MSKLFVQQPLQQRATLVLYLGTVALALIALAATHFAARTALAAQRDTVVLLDLAREQQALAQRIAYLVPRAAEGDHASEFQRGQAAARFGRTHDLLRRGDAALGVSAASAAAFQALYTEGDHPLAADVQGFLDRVRATESGRPQDQKAGEGPDAIARFAGESFPNGLDTIVKAYLRSNAAEADTLGVIERVLSGLVLLALMIQGITVARPLWRRLGLHDEEFTAIGMTDPVTGALTAQSFAKRAVAEIRRARRYRRPVSVLVIATEFSSGTTDPRAMRSLHDSLSEMLRPSDFVGIDDAGVFSVVLPETDLYAVELAGHRILRELDKRPLIADGQSAAVDVRIGAAQVRADEEFPDEPLARAIASLREARAKGGDRVAVSPLRRPLSTGA